MTYAPLRRYGAAASVGIVGGTFIFFLVAIAIGADYFLQRRLFAVCVALALAMSLAFVHVRRDTY